MVKYMIWYKGQVGEMYKLACAPNQDSDQPAHRYSLFSVFDGPFIGYKGLSFHHIC